jgi:uncharacterized protein (TIGR04141 family)
VPGLACYWLKPPPRTAVEPLDSYIDPDRVSDVEAHGPIGAVGYRAKLFVAQSTPHEPRWSQFLRGGFGDGLQTPLASGSAALLVIEIDHRGSRHYMAIVFGFGGRHLLRSGSWHRGYGLRTALNLIYPRVARQSDPGRLISIEAKRRSRQTMRSRQQASRATTVEEFDIDRLRDVMGAASGRPSDSESWGTRVTGADAIYLNPDISFDQLPDVCQRLLDSQTETDYKDLFEWLDDLQPVADRDRIASLESQVVDDLIKGDVGHLDLTPPEIVDWTRVEGFRFHFDRRDLHPDLRLVDYLQGLDAHGSRDQLSIDFLKSRSISAVDGDGQTVHKWPVWLCLVGELGSDQGSVVLDEGEFFDVSTAYLNRLNLYIDKIRQPAIRLPIADGAMRESEYNLNVSQTVGGCLLLDMKTVTSPGQSTPIEICDILTDDREFVHIKRHLGSSDLSHLFAQGLVSATLLSDDRITRDRMRHVIGEASSDNPAFNFVDLESIRPSDFVVVYGVIANWRGRSLAVALPFFSKVNLRITAIELRRRGYEVAFAQIRTSADPALTRAADRARPRLRQKVRRSGSAPAPTLTSD